MRNRGGLSRRAGNSHCRIKASSSSTSIADSIKCIVTGRTLSRTKKYCGRMYGALYNELVVLLGFAGGETATPSSRVVLAIPRARPTQGDSEIKQHSG